MSGSDASGKQPKPLVTLGLADTVASVGARATADEGQWAALAPPEGPEDLQVGTLVGDYRVECRLGQGGMGEVYGAVHPLISKRVAIKVLRRELCASSSMVQRFVLEARAVNRIGHPNIVDVFAFGTLPDGRHYSAMEWLKGESLGQRLRRERLRLGDALDVLGDICRPLEAAHADGIVHRDLKPDNVFLVEVRDQRPLVKLLDFGIAKLVSEHDEGAATTGTGQHIGTPAYSSPEQARGQDVGPKTDTYALGVMAYEMILGRRPFVAASTAQVLAMQLEHAPPSPRDLWPSVPGDLEKFLLTLLAKDPNARPTVPQVRQRIAELRSTLPRQLCQAIPTSVGAPSRSRLGKLSLLIALVVVPLGALVVRGVRRPAVREAAAPAVDAAHVLRTAVPVEDAGVLPMETIKVDVPAPSAQPPAPMRSLPKRREKPPSAGTHQSEATPVPPPVSLPRDPNRMIDPFQRPSP